MNIRLTKHNWALNYKEKMGGFGGEWKLLFHLEKRQKFEHEGEKGEMLVWKRKRQMRACISKDAGTLS